MIEYLQYLQARAWSEATQSIIILWRGLTDEQIIYKVPRYTVQLGADGSSIAPRPESN